MCPKTNILKPLSSLQIKKVGNIRKIYLQNEKSDWHDGLAKIIIGYAPKNIIYEVLLKHKFTYLL